MLFMDWRDSHLNNNMELKKRNNRIPPFYMQCHGLRMDNIQERMVAMLKHLGIRVKSIEEDDHCIIPMGGPLPVLPQRVVGIGGTAGIVQCLGSDKGLSGFEISEQVWKVLWPIQKR